MVQAIPPATRGIVLGLPSALLYALTGQLVGGPMVAMVYGVPMALAGFCGNALGRRPGPRRAQLRFRGTTTRFAGRFAIGVSIGLVFGFAWSLPIGMVALLVVFLGLGIGLHVWVDTPTDANQASSPATVLEQDRIATVSFALSFTISLGLSFAVALMASHQSPHAGITPHTGGLTDVFYPERALPAGLAAALFGWFLFGIPGSLGYGLAGAAIGGQAIPHATPLTTGLLAGALFGTAVALTVIPSRSWGAFLFTRAWLAARGHMPLLLNRFLDDAHRRGALRQTGAIHQFRHARLQDRLSVRQLKCRLDGAVDGSDR
jgi:hypothetical protein